MTNLLREVLKIWNSEQYDLSIITVDEIKNILHESLTKNIKDDKN